MKNVDYELVEKVIKAMAEANGVRKAEYVITQCDSEKVLVYLGSHDVNVSAIRLNEWFDVGINWHSSALKDPREHMKRVNAAIQIKDYLESELN